MSRRQALLLVLAIGFGLAIRLYFYTGLIASDDLTHAYAAHHFWSNPNEAGNLQNTSVNGRRIAVNLPLWLSMRIFGVHEWSMALVPLLFSLGGIVAVFFLVRRLRGDGAGMTAAWLWACLPIDIYTATVFMGDNIFATLFAVMLLLLVMSAQSEAGSRRARLGAMGAGAVVAWMHYLKGTSLLLLGLIGAWLAWRSWRARRIDRRGLDVLVGFVAVEVLAALYFWHAMGAPLVFWKLQFMRWGQLAHSGAQHASTSGPASLMHYAVGQWVFGFAVVLFPVFLVAALSDRAVPCRLLLALLFGFQLALLVKALAYGNWTQRYVLQVSAPYVVLAAVGAHSLWRRLPLEGWRHRRALAGALAAGLVLLTVSAAARENQQHGRFRARVVRDAYLYLDRVARHSDPIYVDSSAEVPTYTRRALALLAGYHRFKGGLRPLDQAYYADRGWVIMTHLEKRHMHLREDKASSDIPANWLEVFHSDNRGGRYFARVFRILPRAVPDGMRVVEKFPFPADVPDASDLPMAPVPLAGEDAPVESRRWHRGLAQAAVAAQGGALRYQATADGKAGHHRGGVMLPVQGLRAVQFDLALSGRAHIRGVRVYAVDAHGRRVAWWWLRGPRHRWGPQYEGTIVLEPELPAGRWVVAGDHMPGDRIAALHLIVDIDRGARAGFTLSDLRLAQDPEGFAQADGVKTFAARRLHFAPVALSDKTAGFDQTWLGGLAEHAVSAVAGGVVFHATAATGAGHHYGGVTVAVKGMVAARFRLTLDHPRAVEAFFVYGESKDGARLSRWRLSRLPGAGGRVLSLSAVAPSSAWRESGEVLSLDDIATLHFLVRVRAGKSAGFELNDLQIASP